MKVGVTLIALSNQYAKQQLCLLFCPLVNNLINSGQVTQFVDYVKSTIRSKEDLRIYLDSQNDVLERNQQDKGPSITAASSTHTPSSTISNVSPTLEEVANEVADSSDKQKLTENINPKRYNPIILPDNSQESYSSDLLPQELLSHALMDPQDSFGNTPLHSVVEAQAQDVDVELVLKSVQGAAECLEAKNEDDLTPLNLAFQKNSGNQLMFWLNIRSKPEKIVCCSRNISLGQ